MEHYDKLIKALDKFIRRYYLNQLLRGGLLLLMGLAAVVLILGLSEYFLFLPAWLKIGVLAILALALSGVLVFWVIRPFLAMQHIGKVISRHQAAEIVGRFFPEVSDKLLNLLQLQGQQHAGESEELAIAGIEQKSAQLSVVPLPKAVNLTGNKRYLTGLIPIVLVIAAIAWLWPQVFRDSAFRLSRPAENFYPPAPFQFQLENKRLQIPFNGDYTLQLKMVGDKLPAQVHLVVGGRELIMQAEAKDAFSYTLHQVTENTRFHFLAGGFRSEDYELKILQRPELEQLSLTVIPPAYTGLKKEVHQGFSDIAVPEGTQLQWHLQTKHTDTVSLRLTNGMRFPLMGAGQNAWQYKMLATGDTVAHFYLSNQQLPLFDTFTYALKVIRDQPPQVMAQQDKDTISGRQVLLTGIASDDYGLSRLRFHYTISDPDNKTETDTAIAIQATHNARSLNFHYYFDINTFHLMPGQTLSYYIEAWDNDAVHGAKKGRSGIFTYRQENKTQLERSIQENNTAINQQITNSANETKDINQDVETFRRKMLDSKGMDWEQQNQLKSLIERQKQVQEQIAALKKRFDMQQRQSRQNQYSENIRKKQEELERQLNKVRNKDLAEQMKKLQELLQEKNKDKTFQDLKQWQEQNKLFQMDMERIKSLMKQVALQMKMEDLARKAESLAKQQDKLADKTTGKQTPADDLKKEQKDLADRLNDLMKKDLAALEKANQETENPQDLSEPKQAGTQAQQEMQQSQNSLQQNQDSKAGSQQKDAADKLNQMAASLSKMAGGMDMQMVDINIKSVRQLLTNLIRYSFAQENLLVSEKVVPANRAAYEKQLQTQNVLKQNTEMIKDSLFSLSKRVFSLAPSINKETSELTGHLSDALSLLEDRKVREARVSQQFAMTNANNLALMLDETLRNLMQMQMQGQKGASGAPSSGKPGAKGEGNDPGQMMKDIITGQQQMGKGMSEMGRGKEGNSGNQPGGGNEGHQESGGDGDRQAEKLVRMAQQQAAIRNMMQELNSMLNSQGNGQNAQLIKEIQKEMNKNETDLVNRRLSSELIRRQQQIMTRLLKAQDAIRNQEHSNKRVAESAKDIQAPMPPELKAALQKRQSFLESYQTIPASLNPFYKQMAEAYRRQIHGE